MEAFFVRQRSGGEDRGAETSAGRCKPAIVAAGAALARCLG